MEGFLKEKFGEALGARIARCTEARLQTLCSDLSGYSRPQKKVLRENTLPRIALYQTLLEQGVDKEQALAIMDEHMVRSAAIPMHKNYEKLDRMPLGWAFFKGGFTTIVSHSDLWDADVAVSRGDFTVTMHRCFWKDTFDRYGCPELCQFACRCDDITYGDLEHIGYHRTQTLGTGGSCCDFRFFHKK